MDHVIAVLDIGKTNKKIAVYNRSLTLVELKSAKFPAVDFEDVRVEQVIELEKWFLSTIRELGKKYDIQAISITTHGAAAVCIGKDGLPAVPVLDYTNEVDEDVHREFYRAVGSPAELQKETCTAEIRPLINVAKLLFYTRRRFPEHFSRVEHVLLYPQYFAYRLTGQIAADYTYVGCHTYLWNFAEEKWSNAAKELDLESLLPGSVDYPTKIVGTLSREVVEKTGLAPETPVLLGVHDSNSSLLPYLYMDDGDFLLNSTGTWCVAMHPEERAVMKDDDIGKTVFYNLSVNNTPVKTAIFMGGLEFETWFTVLQQLHGRDDKPTISEQGIQTVIDAAEDFILPGVVQGAGQYPNSVAQVVSKGTRHTLESIQAGEHVPELFQDYEKAFTVLLLSLVLHTKVAFERAGLKKGTPIYTEGGFRQNKWYNKLLTVLFPENPVHTTGIEEATSYGAAWLGWAAVENKELKSMSEYTDFQKKLIKPVRIDGIEKYAEKFFSLLEDYSK